MGGAVSAIADVVTAPASIANTVLSHVPVVGPILGPAVATALGGPTAGIASLAGNMATNAFTGGGGGGGGGGGSSPTAPTITGGTGTTGTTPGVTTPSAPTLGGNSNTVYADPMFDYGHNTYKADDNLIDTSKYFVKGDTGVFNLLPQLNTVAADPTNSSQAYNSIFGSMSNDPTAQATFQKNFGTNAAAADFGLGAPATTNVLNNLAGYTATNANPSFVGYKPAEFKQVNVRKGGIINLVRNK